MNHNQFISPRRLPVGILFTTVTLIGLCVVFHINSHAQDRLRIEVMPEDKIELAWPVSGLEQELETSNDLAADSWSKVNDQIQFVENRYRLATDNDGTRRFYRVRQVIPPTSEISESSPPHGAGGVAVNRETVIQFNTPLSNSTFVTDDAVYAEFGGEMLATRTQLSTDRRTITLFFDDPLPNGAQITITINGELLEDIAGRKIDANSDGNPGGIGKLVFNTLSLATIPGTAVVGQVLASELGEENGQLINNPLQGVTITLDGKEDTVKAITDSEGNFKLEPVPGGEFFVHIDGRTAVGSQFPDGAYYPFVGKSWVSIPGRDDTLAGGTGVIHLPLIQAASLQEVSATEDTTITFMDDIVQEFPELNGVSITVPANSLFNDDGTRGGSVGIAPVPPDRLPGELPEMFSFPIVITVQTDGANNFDNPASVKFPNLPDPNTGEILPPGAKTGLWSFNHDSGRWELQGQMTISEDGLYAVSNPGVGISAPGWHGANPGGGGGGGGGGPGGEPGPPNPPRPPRPPDAPDCETERRLAISAGEQCAVSIGTSFIKAIPVVGCGIGFVTASMGAAADCGIDPDSCGSTVLSQTAGAMLGCVPVIGTAGGLIYDCLYQGGQVLNELDQCEPFLLPTSFPISSKGNYFFEDQTQAVASSLPLNPFEAQAEVLAAAAEFYSLIYGDAEWTRIDPEEWPIAEPFLNRLHSSIESASEEGELISQNELDILMQLPRASNITESIVSDTIDRIDRMNRNLLTAEELNGEAIHIAAVNLFEILTELQNRGWETVLDGLIKTAESIAFDADALFGGRNRSRSTPPGDPILQVSGIEPPEETYFLRSNFYYRLTNLSNGFVQRGQIGPLGKFDNIFLVPNSLYVVDYADPQLSEVAITIFTSGEAGTITQIPRSFFVPDDSPDTDGDGAADFIEEIIGTNSNLVDTDQDGVSDQAELINGTNPLDGIPVSTGVVGATEVDFPTIDVIAINNFVITANEEAGIRLYDITDTSTLILLSNLSFQKKATTVSTYTDRVAVGAGDTLFLVNISDPLNPFINNAIILDNITKVYNSGPYVYTSTDTSLYKHDAYTGELLGQVQSNPKVTDIAAFDGKLYTLASSFPPSGQNIVEVRSIMDELGDPLYSLTLPPEQYETQVDTHITVGDGFVYLGGIGAPLTIPGVTIIEDTGEALSVVGPPAVITTFDVAIDGTNELLYTGAEVGLTNRSLAVLDISEPTETGNLLTSYNTRGSVESVVIHNGLAYAADGDDGLKVINYSTIPLSVSPPEITLMTDVPGSTVEADEWIFAKASISSENRIRNVEFIVNDKLVVSDGGFPFEQYLRMAQLAGDSSKAIISLRAIDMAGNIVTSPPIEYDVVDTKPPGVTMVTPREGIITFTTNLNEVTATFNENVDETTLTPQSFYLTEAGPDKISGNGDDTTLEGQVTYDSETFTANLVFTNDLEKGLYTGVLESTISDTIGNSAETPYTWFFELWEPNTWVPEIGGFWDTISNWSEGAVRNMDSIIIDVPDQLVATSIPSGFWNISSLVSEESLTLKTARLSVIDTATINGVFTWFEQGALEGGGTTIANGGIDIVGAGNKSMTDHTLINNGEAKWMIGGLGLHGKADTIINSLGASWEFLNETFSIMSSSVSVDPIGFINQGTVIKNSSGLTRLQELPFQNLGMIDVKSGELEIFSSALTGTGSITVRTGAILSFETVGNFEDPGALLEGSLLLEDDAILQFEAGKLETTTGSEIAGNGDVAIRAATSFGNPPSTVTINGFYDVRSTLIEARSKANFGGIAKSGSTQFQGISSELGGDGLFETTGDFTWTGGTMLGGGVTQVRGNLLMEGTDSMTLNNRTLEVYGEAIGSGSQTLTVTQDSPVEIIIKQGGIWRHRDSFQIDGFSPATQNWVFTNEGSFITEGGVDTAVDMEIQNSGLMQLDATILTVAKSFNQEAGGILNLSILAAPADANSHSQLSSDAELNLGGAVQIQLGQGFTPDVGASYTILNGSSRTGEFDTVTGLAIAGDRKFEVVYTDTGVQLNVVAVP